MEELDRWTEATVIGPISTALLDAHEGAWQQTTAAVKAAVRAKVLESYKNGRKAGGASPKGDGHGR